VKRFACTVALLCAVILTACAATLTYHTMTDPSPHYTQLGGSIETHHPGFN
jgi:hypothetical protein